MEWSLWVLLALVGGFFLWRTPKRKEAAIVATDRLKRDTRLYQHIKAGIREYHWRERDHDFCAEGKIERAWARAKQLIDG